MKILMRLLRRTYRAGYIPRRMLRKEKTLTETNVLNLRWIFTRPAMDANVKVL